MFGRKRKRALLVNLTGANDKNAGNYWLEEGGEIEIYQPVKVINTPGTSVQEATVKIKLRCERII